MIQPFRSATGAYLGEFSPGRQPPGAIAVPAAPRNAGATWVNGQWQEPPAAVVPRPITKLALYERVTDEELELLEGFLATQATVRQRLRWMDAQEIDRNDVEVQALAVALYGEARAAEILA